MLYSRTGFVICYASCPFLWMRKLQTEMALSTAGAEYTTRSQALRETKPLMNLMWEVDVIFKLHIPRPKFILKVHEDNQSYIAMANNLKFTPQTKHISIKYHHFWKHLKMQSNKDRFIGIIYCSTDNQTADIFTKPTRYYIFFKSSVSWISCHEGVWNYMGSICDPYCRSLVARNPIVD